MLGGAKMSKVRPTCVASVFVTSSVLVAALALGACRREAAPPLTNPAATRNLPPDAAPPSVDASAPVPARSPEPGADPADVAPTTAPSPPAPEPPRVPQTQHSGRVDGPIPYLVVEPAGAAADLPLVIALHGRGDRAENFARVAEELALPVRTLVARPPLPFGVTGGRQWFELSAPDAEQQVLGRVQDVVALMDRLKETYPEAPAPVLLGFSQGAMLALQVAARHPDRVRAVVALSGALPVTQGNAEATTPVPMLLTLGKSDTLVPPERTRAAAEALQALGHRPEVFEFQGAHQIPAVVMARVRAFVSGLVSPT